jgi:hypothetical protein
MIDLSQQTEYALRSHIHQGEAQPSTRIPQQMDIRRCRQARLDHNAGCRLVGIKSVRADHKQMPAQ